MARVKLTARKHVRVPPRRNVVPTESHSDGQNAGYFPRTLRTLLLALGYSEPPLFIGVLRLLHRNSYLWHVRVIINERTNDQSYSSHPSRGRGYHTEVDIRGRHEGGCMRSFGAATIWSGGTNGAITVPWLPKPCLRRSWSCRDARRRS
jgi:hypothetical protein